MGLLTDVSAVRRKKLSLLSAWQVGGKGWTRFAAAGVVERVLVHLTALDLELGNSVRHSAVSTGAMIGKDSVAVFAAAGAEDHIHRIQLR